LHIAIKSFIEDYIERKVILFKINMLANILQLAWNLVYRLKRINELKACGINGKNEL